jgi:hypothetical protein
LAEGPDDARTISLAFAGKPELGSAAGLRPQPVVRRTLASAAVALFALVTDSVHHESRVEPREAVARSPGEASEIVSLVPREQRQGTDRGGSKHVPPPSRKGHILIPTIGVDAPLIPLGISPDGTLEVPEDWGVAGWFTGGAFPGEPGPAIVAGHVDSTIGPAVFYRLPELRPGDVIVVWRNGDLRSRFRVISLKWFPKSAFPTQRVYGSVASPALRLITCGGAFDSSTGHYVDNLVVFASPIRGLDRSPPDIRRSRE